MVSSEKKSTTGARGCLKIYGSSSTGAITPFQEHPLPFGKCAQCLIRNNLSSGRITTPTLLPHNLSVESLADLTQVQQPDAGPGDLSYSRHGTLGFTCRLQGADGIGRRLAGMNCRSMWALSPNVCIFCSDERCMHCCSQLLLSLIFRNSARSLLPFLSPRFSFHLRRYKSTCGAQTMASLAWVRKVHARNVGMASMHDGVFACHLLSSLRPIPSN